MTHQVIAFTRSMRREAEKTVLAPLSSVSGPSSPAPTNHTVALTIALRYLAARDRIPNGLVPGIRLQHDKLK
ncbi:MAG: hypothetical protein EPO08_16925 [Rhodospirillaceae bacterium]|nr:MAG: hypothetical protein EPO08_16925 [Rhodospirillaceae bacterium]